jgi:nucleotide-binding universal stress UspA family protein
MESRRKFLTAIVTVGVPAGMFALMPSAQVRGQRPQNPQPQQQKDDDPNAPKLDSKLILEANQKEIKKSVEKLYDLASELKAEVEKTDSVQVLSLAMLKKTDEIEKLAREIRSRAKG